MIRGKDCFTRASLRAELRSFNALADGPWEPAAFFDDHDCDHWGPAHVGHDPEAELDIHLPGDGAPFNEDAAIAKLMIAPVLCSMCRAGRIVGAGT